MRAVACSLRGKADQGVPVKSTASRSQKRSLRGKTLRVGLGGPRALALALLAASWGQGWGSAAGTYSQSFGGMPAGTLGGGESFMDMMRSASGRQQGLREVVPSFSHNRMEMMFREDDAEHLFSGAGPQTFETLDEVQDFLEQRDGREEMLLGMVDPGPVHGEVGGSGRDPRERGGMGRMEDKATEHVSTSSGTRERTHHLFAQKGHGKHAQYLGGLGAVRGGGSMGWGEGESADGAPWDRQGARRAARETWGGRHDEEELLIRGGASMGRWEAGDSFDPAPRAAHVPHETIRETWGGQHDEAEVLGFEQPRYKRANVHKEKHPRLRAEVRYRGKEDDYYGLTSPGSEEGRDGAPPVKRRLFFDDMAVDNGSVESLESRTGGPQGARPEA